FGGYVKMLDAREQKLDGLAEQDLAREFTRQSVWKRIAIVAAGPLANFLLAIAVFAGLYSYGMPEPGTRLRAVPEASAAHDAGLRGGERIVQVNGESVQTWSELRWEIMQGILDGKSVRIGVEPEEGAGAGPHFATLSLASVSPSELEGDFLTQLGLQLARPPAVLGRVGTGGPAERAGLREGDVISAVNGEPIADALGFVERVRAAPGKSLLVRFTRDGATSESVVTPEAHEQGGQSIGRIQVEVPLAPEMVTVRSGPIEAVADGVAKTWDTSVLTLKMLAKMLVGEVSWKNISGPITIADYAGQTARIGLISYLTFLAFISISLGVMNLLPIPVLDGGHLLYYSLELLTGRPVSERFGEIAQRAGVGILMALMAVAVFNDIMRLMS
ncbi:MAG TPA: RIP metalloprotease RseP, partial [Noviherbaspirillum sp.]